MFKPDFTQPIKEETTIINEAYFGSKPIEKIQTQLTKARVKYLNQYFQKAKYAKNINIDPDMIQLNRCFEEAFGFKSFALYIYSSTIENACTVPVSFRIDSGFNISRALQSSKSKGYYYNKDAEFSTMVMMSTGIFCNPDITDREVVAIILHEIGHNFTSAIDHVSNLLVLPTRLLYTIAALMNYMTLIEDPDKYVKQVISGTNVTLSAYNKINDKINKNAPWFKEGAHIFGKYVSILRDLGIEILTFLNNISTLSNPLIGIATTLITKISQITPFTFFNVYKGYRDEKFADAFATSYGYGPDLATGLDKLGNHGSGLFANQMFNDFPLIGTILNLYKIPTQTISYLFDAHPKTLARINNQLDYCKMELDNADLDPKMEKELRKNIKEIDSYIQKVYNGVDKTKVDFNDAFYYKKIYAYWLLKMCGGDIREKQNPTKDIYDAMEKAKNKSSIEKVKLR